MASVRQPISLSDRNVSIFGLGYVGLTLGVAMADAGFRVHGVEIRQQVLDLLVRGEPHFYEPRLKEKLQRVIKEGAFTFSKLLPQDFPTNVYIITVGTPLGADGEVLLDGVRHAATEVAARMAEDALVILRSTVTVGTARSVVMPVLQASGRSFDIAVCPERTLEGRALIELRELPQIIGADTPEIRDRCARIFGVLTHTTVRLSSLEAAELTKLVDNTYRDVMFGFANEVARICSHCGLSALEVIRAGSYGYARTNVASPGPVGGPCLEKDAHLLIESARAMGIKLDMTAAGRTINERQPAETMRMLRERCAATPGFPPELVITVAGLAFKGAPPTDDLRGTMARPIIAAVRAEFPRATVRGYDPLVSAAAARAAFDIETVPDLRQAFDDANIVILANNHYELQRMDVAALAQGMRAPGFVYDYWNLHDDVDSAMPTGVSYIGLGAEKFWAGT